MNEPALVEVAALAKSYRKGSAPGGLVRVLEELDFSAEAGSSTAIQGESGTGKTTLLNILGGLDRPDRGVVRHRGRPLPADPAQRARWRGREVGFIFQFHGLLREFTALENVALAGLIIGRPRREATAEARRLLEVLGLGQRADHHPDELSGGEQQRVAVARALFSGPGLVLADEPTGNLDPATGDKVLDLLFALQEERGFALVVATHSGRLARRCQRILRLDQGRLHPATHALDDDLPPGSGTAERMTP